jgi:hypothetical protein
LDLLSIKNNINSKKIQKNTKKYKKIQKNAKKYIKIQKINKKLKKNDIKKIDLSNYLII